MSSSSGSTAALPDETLRRVLEQIQLTLASTSRQLSLVRAQKAGKEREKKSMQLTQSGLSEEVKSTDARCFRGVGKMFVLDSHTAIEKTIVEQIHGVQSEIEALGKKQKFLEKQFAEAQGHMKDFVRNVESQQQPPEAQAAS